MNKQMILTCVLVGTFFLPSNAMARKNDNDGYKPKNSVQKAEKRKKRRANKAGKKRNAKKAAKKPVGQKKRNAHKRPKVAAKPHYAPAPRVHTHKKKKKHKKLKRFFKKTLKLLAQEAYGHNHHYAKPRRYNDYRPVHANRHCLPKRKVFRRLRSNGWRHIELINQGPNRARLFATNPYHERYKLVVHKCSGRVIKTRPIYNY